MQHKLLVVDTETSGLDAERYSLLSLAAVVWMDREIVDSLELYVLEPNIEFDQRALDINRIDLDWLGWAGLPPAPAVGVLEAFLCRHFPLDKPDERVTLAGHNIGFDIPFLKRLYRLAGVSYSSVFSHRTIDTASIIRFFILAGRLTLSGAGSEEAFAHFGIEVAPNSRHTALADALATAQLLNRLIDLINGSPALAAATG